MPSSVSFFCFHTSFRSWNFSVAAAWSSGLALSGWCSAAFFRYAFLIWSGVACGEEREKKREKGECNFWWAGIFFPLFFEKKKENVDDARRMLSGNRVWGQSCGGTNIMLHAQPLIVVLFLHAFWHLLRCSWFSAVSHNKWEILAETRAFLIKIT